MNPPPPAPVPAGPRTQEMTEALAKQIYEIGLAEKVKFDRIDHGGNWESSGEGNRVAMRAVAEHILSSQSAPSGLVEENRRLREMLQECATEFYTRKQTCDGLEARIADKLAIRISALLQTSAAPVKQ